MKDSAVIKYIRAAIPDANVNADATAKVVFGKAVAFVGRMPNVDFNRKWVTFNFVSGTSSYVIGKDILSDMSDIMRANVLTSTDNVQPIQLISIQDYRALISGLTTSGRPTHATIHSANKTLEVYPTPDSAYEYGLYVQKTITRFEDIPDAYHDVVCDIGVTMVKALLSQDPSLSAMFMKEGLSAMKFDHIIGWSGSNISVARGLDRGGGGRTATSYNLLGD